MTAQRERLPNRRNSEAGHFDLGGLTYRWQASRFDDGRLAEIFLDGPKIGTDARVLARDAAVATSVALQFGASSEVLLHSFEKLANGAPAGPAGRCLAMLRSAAG